MNVIVSVEGNGGEVGKTKRVMGLEVNIVAWDQINYNCK
jgi:hypothetical protein